MASPAVAATTEGGLTATGTSLAVTLPGSGSADDLYIVIIAKGSGSNTINALTDWTELLDENQAAGIAILYYTGAGVPSNPTFTQSANSRSVWGAYRITGANKAIVPQIGTTATGTSTTPDPPSVTVTSGPKDVLAIACFAVGGAVELADDDTLVTTFPTNYTAGQIEKTGGTTGTNLGGMLGAAARQVSAASSENPGTFTQNASRAWRAQTIVVHPDTPGVSQAAYTASLAADGTQTGPSYTLTPTASAVAIVTSLSLATTTAVTTVNGGVAAETDTAPAGTLSQPQTPVAGSVASEADTAPAGTISQPQTPTLGGVASEADTAPAGTLQLGTETTVGGEVAAEADAAPAGTIQQPQVPIAGGVAGETDSVPAGSVLTATGGATQAAYTATKASAASQTGPSYTLTPDGADAPAIVTALSIVTVAGAPTTVAGGLASETDSAPAGTPITGAAQTVSGGVASEDDTAPAGTADVVAGGLSQAAYTADKETPASQTGPSYTITPDGPAAVAIVTALSIRSVPATVISGGVASETDTAPAGALLAAQTVAGGTAQEADSAPAAAISTWPVIGPFIGSEFGYVPIGALAEVAAVGPAVRALGDLTVTTAGIARPTGQANIRSLGAPTVTGRHLEPTGQAHARGQGTPTLSARTLPTGQAHTRGQGAPSVNLRTLTPTALSNTRNLGAPAATLVKIGRPDALTHTARALGAPTARGFMTIGPPGQANTRAQGTPVLSGRALPAGLAHARQLGDTAVNVRTLELVALDRA